MLLKELELDGYQMISYAGDALNDYYQAIIELRKNKNKDKANECIASGNKCLIRCHKIQTKLIHKEAAGESIPYSLLMTHAQDHLMTAMNWQRTAQIEFELL